MILDACNTSAEIEIEGTEKDFTNIYTNEFPGKKYLILLPLLLGISRLRAVNILLLQNLERLFFLMSAKPKVIF